MTLNPLGDSAWLVEWRGGGFQPPCRDVDGPAVGYRCHERALATVMAWTSALEINRPAGVVEVLPSFASIAVYYDDIDGNKVREWIEERLNNISTHRRTATRYFEIPVCYDGADLAEVADLTGLSEEDVIALHAYGIYTVAAVGFSPGFPYLLGLPQRLHLPRRRTPRIKVPAGSVAIGGGQAGIYPFDSPGGWYILGTTAVSLFDPRAAQPALLRPGDYLRFKRVDFLETKVAGASCSSPCKERPAPIFSPTEQDAPFTDWSEDAPATRVAAVKVIDGGALTTIQDAGRFGYGSAGVSPNGAADLHALRLANLLVGNDEAAPVLEICMRGPVLQFLEATTVSMATEGGKSWSVAAGETVDFSKLTGGVRACIGIAGGLRGENLLDSAATDLRAGFGGYQGRALKAGDLLATGTAGRVPKPGDWHVGWLGRRADSIELRFVRGVQSDWFSKVARQRFSASIFQVTPDSDSMGVRLAGPQLDLEQAREMVSQPVACGSVQVPPDGQAIVLLAGRQTIGGYPQIGHVVSVDLPKLARAWPGTKVTFREVNLEQSWELKRRDERDMAWLRVGLEFRK